jgi:peptide/nickel transport system permease protein
MMRHLLRTPAGLIGSTSLALLLASAALSLVWTPYDPLAVDAANGWAPFSAAHPLGTDALGRDQVSALLVGARVTVAATVVATALSAVLGIAIAFVLALTPPAVTSVLQRLIDIAVAFPTLIVAIILVTSFGASTLVAAIAIGLAASVVVARTVAPEIRSALSSDFVLLAEAAGAGAGRILFRHVLPTIAPTLLVRVTQIMAAAALAEAGLSYLGLGTPAPTPSWGRSLADLQAQIMLRPEYLAAPAIAIVIVVLGLNLLGDALRDGLDPRAVVRGDANRTSRRRARAAGIRPERSVVV